MYLFGKKQPASPVQPPTDNFNTCLERATLSLRQADLSTARINSHRALAFADTEEECAKVLLLLGQVACQTERARLGGAYFKLALSLAEEIKDQSLVETINQEARTHPIPRTI